MGLLIVKDGHAKTAESLLHFAEKAFNFHITEDGRAWLNGFETPIIYHIGRGLNSYSIEGAKKKFVESNYFMNYAKDFGYQIFRATLLNQ